MVFPSIEINKFHKFTTLAQRLRKAKLSCHWVLENMAIGLNVGLLYISISLLSYFVLHSSSQPTLPKS